MTLQSLIDGLKAAVPETYPDAAPQGVRRCVVVQPVNRLSIYGDDRNAMDAQRVQLDILTQSASDYLVDDVVDALWALNLPYTVESEGYDPDYNRFRTILSLVVI